MDNFIKHFSEDVGRAVKETLSEHCQAIQFLEDSQRVACYLSGESEQEQQILILRSKLAWFDCALLTLEGLIDANTYDQQIKSMALYHLQLYYRPSEQEVKAAHDESRLRSLWHWLTSQANPLVNSFLQNCQDATAMALPIPAGSSSYVNGAPYQTVSFHANLPQHGNKLEEFSVNCEIAFYWIMKKEYMPDKAWGKIELKTLHKEGQQYFTTAQKKQFLSLLHIDLYQQVRHSEQHQQNLIIQNLKCNQFGEFEIPNNWDNVKKSLDKNSLGCVVKLTR